MLLSNSIAWVELREILSTATMMLIAVNRVAVEFKFLITTWAGLVVKY